jgi:hypothetical protein
MNKSKNQFQKVARKNNNGRNKRSWPVTILALLLAFQGFAILFLAIYQLALMDLSLLLKPMVLFEEYSLTVERVAFWGLGMLGLIACIGFLRIWSFAWILAIAQQGFILTLAIILYFQERPIYIYPLMAFSIFMVIYLHYSDVMATFRTRPITEEWGGIDEQE